AIPFTQHLHISEPDLQPFPQKTTPHAGISRIINQSAYKKYVSIEMRGNVNGSNSEQIKTAILFVQTTCQTTP
ncbi:MAG: hypothetical protein NUV98_03555, partial [Candidatus Roizmanbacteria bacterium]|nr:hypothetical protein [Candidatus Roizmanbacteria bacterium]